MNEVSSREDLFHIFSGIYLAFNDDNHNSSFIGEISALEIIWLEGDDFRSWFSGKTLYSVYLG